MRHLTDDRWRVTDLWRRAPDERLYSLRGVIDCQNFTTCELHRLCISVAQLHFPCPVIDCADFGLQLCMSERKERKKEKKLFLIPAWTSTQHNVSVSFYFLHARTHTHTLSTARPQRPNSGPLQGQTCIPFQCSCHVLSQRHLAVVHVVCKRRAPLPDSVVRQDGNIRDFIGPLHWVAVATDRIVRLGLTADRGL